MAYCRRTTERLAPYIDGSLSPAEHDTIQQHLADCEPCRRAAEAVDGGRLVMREAGARLSQSLPPGLRSRCEALARTPAARPSWWRGLVPAFAIIAIVASTVAVLMAMATERSNVLLAQQLVVDHMKCFLFTSSASSPSAGNDEPVLDRKYAPNLHVPPSSAAAGVTLIGARRCLYASGVIPHLMYRAGGRNLSLFVLDGVRRANADVVAFGYRARIWSDGGRSYVLVDERADADLNGEARYLMQQVH